MKTHPGPLVHQSAVTIRPLRDRDLGYVVSEHLAQFPDGFFAKLGPGFLMRYYRAYVCSDSAVALAADLEGQLVGYLIGATDPGTHRRDMLRRSQRPMLLHGLLGLLRHPWLVAPFVRTRARRYARRLLRRRRMIVLPVAAGSSGPVSVIGHVAVSSEHRDRGAGRALMDAFVDRARAAGSERVSLVTVAGPQGSGGYYRRLGWEAAGEHLDRDGRLLTTYELRL